MESRPPYGAALSSTYGGYQAGRCTDGDVGTFCHTDQHDHPWLSIDLTGDGDETTVGIVVITNRQDCCQDRLAPFEV